MCHVPDILQRLKVTIDIFCKSKAQWWFFTSSLWSKSTYLDAHSVNSVENVCKISNLWPIFSQKLLLSLFFFNLTFESWCRGILWWFWYLICLNWMFCIWFHMIGGTKLRYSCALYLYKIFLPLNSSLIYSLMLTF